MVQLFVHCKRRQSHVSSTSWHASQWPSMAPLQRFHSINLRSCHPNHKNALILVCTWYSIFPYEDISMWGWGGGNIVLKISVHRTKLNENLVRLVPPLSTACSQKMANFNFPSNWSEGQLELSVISLEASLLLLACALP